MAPLNSSRKKFSGGKGSKSTKNSDSSDVRNKISKRPRTVPPLERKTKSKSGPVRKRRVYTDEELGIPKLNTITPVGVDIPKGKKKGKVFVDDQEGMMTILSIVNASKEDQIESKLVKSRHMEEVREARRKEAEARQEQKKSKLNETKDSLRRKRRRKPVTDLNEAVEHQDDKQEPKTGRKRVSFA